MTNCNTSYQWCMSTLLKNVIAFIKKKGPNIIFPPCPTTTLSNGHYHIPVKNFKFLGYALHYQNIRLNMPFKCRYLLVVNTLGHPPCPVTVAAHHHTPHGVISLPQTTYSLNFQYSSGMSKPQSFYGTLEIMGKQKKILNDLTLTKDKSYLHLLEARHQ